MTVSSTIFSDSKNDCSGIAVKCWQLYAQFSCLTFTGCAPFLVHRFLGIYSASDSYSLSITENK